MKKKNIIIIVIVALIIGIVTFLLMQNSKREERNYNIEKIEEINYFVLQSDNGYGVIGKDSKIVIEPKYQNVVIPNPSKAVFVCTPTDGKAKVYNDKNEEILTNYEEVSAIKLKNIATNFLYEKSVLKYKKEGKYGLIDFSGKEITKPIYGSIEALEYKEGELVVEQEGKFGVININGTNLVEPQYETIKVDGYYTEQDGYKKAGYIVGIKTEEGYRYGYISIEGNLILNTEFNEINRVSNLIDNNNIYFIASKNGQYGLYKNSDSVLNTEYQSIVYNQTNNIFVIEKSRKFGFTDINGKTIVETKYAQIDITGNYIYAKNKQDEIEVFDAKGNAVNMAANITKLPVADNKYNIVMTIENNQTLYGVEDSNGKQIIPSDYTYIEYLFDNYFIVCNKNGLLGVVDNNNNEKIEQSYNSVQAIKNEKLIQASTTKENLVTIYNKDFEKLCELKSASMSKVGDVIKYYNDEEVYYIDKNGKLSTNKVAYPNNKLYAKKENGKWGFVDNQDKVIVNYEYDRVTEFNEYGFAGILKNGKWGVLDSEGKVIQEPKYEIKDNSEPVFLGKYYKVTYGFGEIYYSNK